MSNPSLFQQLFLSSTIGPAIHRDISIDDARLATALADTLRELAQRPLRPIRNITPRLQGNLVEFSVWELGESHWRLYRKEYTWPANATSPWRDHPKSGIDILGIDDNADCVFIIEVKSTNGGGNSAIDGATGSLKEDFEHLFLKSTDAPEARIWGSIQDAVTVLTIRGHGDLALKVVNAVGDKPEACSGIRLVGVLVCKRGANLRSHNARVDSFRALHEWLKSQGWQEGQCQYRCVELADFSAWLQQLVDEAVR